MVWLLFKIKNILGGGWKSGRVFGIAWGHTGYWKKPFNEDPDTDFKKMVQIPVYGHNVRIFLIHFTGFKYDRPINGSKCNDPYVEKPLLLGTQGKYLYKIQGPTFGKGLATTGRS